MNELGFKIEIKHTCTLFHDEAEELASEIRNLIKKKEFISICPHSQDQIFVKVTEEFPDNE